MTVSVPSATAARASSRLSASSAGPSSTPGSRWKWSSTRAVIPDIGSVPARGIRWQSCELGACHTAAAMGNPRYGLRAAAPLGCAALGLHELRYLIAYGGQSGDELARQGHAYLPFVTVAAATLLALACAQLLAVLSRARRSGAPGG